MTAQEQLRAAAELVDAALAQLDRSETPESTQGHRIFTNFMHAKVYWRLKDVAWKLRKEATFLDAKVTNQQRDEPRSARS